MRLCLECGNKIEKDDKVKLIGMKLVHMSCHRKYINRINGRSVLCPECKGSGYTDKPLIANTGYSRQTNNICSKCSGNGYVSGV